MNTRGLIFAQYLCTGTVLVAFGHSGEGVFLLAVAALVLLVAFVNNLPPSEREP